MGEFTPVSPPIKIYTKDSLLGRNIKFSKPTLLRKERKGEFPKRFYLSATIPAWDGDKVEAWLAERMAASVEQKPDTSAATSESVKVRREKKAVPASGGN